MVCYWKPSWPVTIDYVLWTEVYSFRKPVFLWGVGHAFNSWLRTAMQLMDTVIMLNADKRDKVHKVLDVAFSFPSRALNARDQWPHMLTWLDLKQLQAHCFTITAIRGRSKTFFTIVLREFQEMKSILHQGKMLPEYIDAVLRSCIIPDILCVSPCLMVLWPTNYIPKLPLE